MTVNVLLVKIGGGAAINLEAIAADLATMPDPVIVVHGANAARDALADRLGIVKQVITSASGFSSVLSDDKAIELIAMAYAGLVNTRVVEALQRAGRNAIGLSGLDGRVVAARRNPGIRAREGEKTVILRDRSGKPTSVNTALLELLLEQGYTPVLTVPLVDEQGYAVNADNDDVVALLREALGIERVVQLIEAPGFLADPADPLSVIRRLTPEQLEALEGQATGRFKRKVYALRKLFRGASPRVVLGDGRGARPVTDALAGKGTVIAGG